MTESAIKSNEREAARLFERGVAAARGGQRRIAAGLLARAVQLNPRHELGWLWLSGVLDAPEEIAFCLRSVLAVNPHNERAQQGLAWLEQRNQIVKQPVPARLAELPAEAHPEAHAHEAWWVVWRRTHRDTSRARQVLWLIPILLIGLTLGLNMALRGAIERNEARARAAAQPPAPPQATARPQVVALIQAELPIARDARTLAYLSALEPARAQLRAAVLAYRDATSRPGGSSIAHAAAARALREQIDQAYATIDALEAPAGLAQAHNRYLAGLEIERQALGDMLEFYSSLSIQYANRATLRMGDSAREIAQANQGFAGHQGPAHAPALPQQTAR